MDANKIKCFLFGHKKSVPMLIEDDDHLFISGCPRCNAPIGFVRLWKTCPPPPNSTPEQIESLKKFIAKETIKWREYVAKEQARLRKKTR